jgi:cell wall-associated NlpC family hydrolase
VHPRSTSLIRVLATCWLALLMLASPASAVVTTPEIEAKKAAALEAQAALDVMRDDLEMRVEEYNRITETLGKTRAEIQVARQRLEEADTDLAAAKAVLGSRASGIYRGGGEVDVFEVLLGTTSFEDFLTRLDLLRLVSANDARLVGRVKDARMVVVQTKQTLERREAEQIALRRQADVKKREIEAEVERQREFVGSLNSEVAEEERQRRVAEEAARALAEAARRLAEQQAANGGGSVGVGEGDAPYTGPISPDGAGHPECVGIAARYLGVPYVWGGTTPKGFDCSGLVQYVYAKIGVTLPRVSQDQYHAGLHIPSDRLDLLKPGDLVFFGRGGNPDLVHHVGMYVGEGNFIHAPASGQDVRISSLTERIALKHDYVGASRL